MHLVVTDLEIGGTPRVVRDLAIRLRPLGFATRVTCLAPWGPVADELAAAGVPVSAVGVTSARQLPAAVRAVRTATAGADVIYSLLVHANVVSALANSSRATPLVQSIQTTQSRPRWHWWLQAWAARAADRIIVPSQSVADVATERSAVPPAQLVVIPNAVEAIAGAAIEIPTTPWRVGFIGRLDPVKRVPDLVAAVADVPDCRLDVFGEGQARGTIEDTIGRFGVSDRVTLHGAIASATIALNALDVLVLPSEAEGFGLVLIEAMAAGVPVIGTDVPGIRDVIRHGENGLLVPPGQPPALAAAIRQIQSDSAFRGRLIAGGRSTVRDHFNWDAVLQVYNDLFLQLHRRAAVTA